MAAVIRPKNRNFLLLFLLVSSTTSINLVNIVPIPSTFTPPMSRLYHTMDYNQATNSLVIFGGSQDITNMFNDV